MFRRSLDQITREDLKWAMKKPVFAAGIIVIAFIWLAASYQIALRQERARENLTRHISNLAVTFEQSIIRTVSELDHLLRFVRVARSLNATMSWDELLRSDNALLKHRTTLSVIDPTGIVVANTAMPQLPFRIDLSDREHFRVHLNATTDELFVSKPMIGRIMKQMSIQFTRAAYNEDGNLSAVIVASLAQNKLTEGFQSVALGERGGLALIGLDGVVRAGTGAFASGMLSDHDRAALDRATNDAGTSTYAEEVDGIARLVASRRSVGMPLRVVAAADTSAFAAPSTQELATYIGIAVLGSLLTLLTVCAILIVDRKEIERSRFEVDKKVAEAAGNAKSLFLAVMSHEIRTPLNGVLGALELIRADALPLRTRRHVEMATESGEALLGLIDDVLLVSKIEAAQFTLYPEPFNFDKLVASVQTSLGALAIAAGNTLDVEMHSGRIGQLSGDAKRLRQVLVNLVGNAIKFTKNGRIVIETRLLEASDGQARLRICVSDEGIGIPKDKIGVIFDQFQTLDSSLTRRTGGTGLGLSISDRIVKAMGGEIKVESEVGAGSRFSFDITLPYAAVESTMPERESPAPPLLTVSSCRVLLAEDNATNAYICEEYLSAAGHHVQLAVNGREAVNLCQRELFDIILMDISMPVMDGIEATRMIRAEGSLNAETRIVALTAHATGGDHARFLAAGMNGHLIKPINREKLLEAVGGSAVVSVPVTHTPVPAAVDLIDTAAFAEFKRGRSPDKVHRSVSLFLRELIEKEELLRFAIAARDAQAVCRVAHAARGSGSMIGATRLVGLATAIEQTGEADPGGVWAYTAALGEAITRSIAAFRQIVDTAEKSRAA